MSTHSVGGQSEPVRFGNGMGWVAALLLVAGPLLQVVEFLLVPGFEEPADRAAYWAQHADAAGLSLTAGLLAIPFLIAMFAIMVRLSVGRSPAIAWAAAALLTAAMVGLAAVHGVEIAAFGLVNNDNLEAATHVLGGSEVGLPGLLLLVMFLASASLGILLISIALWRSRSVPLLAPVLLVAFAVIDFAAGQPVIAHLVGLAAAAVVAYAVITGYGRKEAMAAPPATSTT